MNNIKYYNDSLAYDFEMFMPKTAKAPEKQDNIIVLPKVKAAERKRRRSAAKSMSKTVMLLMAALFVLAGLCGNIALRLQINEINSEINDMKSAIFELDSEKTQLEVEMQRRLTFANLELEAVQLGMKKLEKSNVVYIRVNDKDVAKTKDGNIVKAE